MLISRTYLKKIIDKFGMSNSNLIVKPTNPQFKLSTTLSPSTEVEKTYMNSISYASIVGSFMYVMVCTRLNIAYRVSLVRRYMVILWKVHSQALKWNLRYINGSLSIVMIYGGAYGDDSKVKIEGFVDSDYSSCIDSINFIFGYMFTMFGTIISWKETL